MREVTPDDQVAMAALSGPNGRGALSFDQKLTQAKELAKNDPKLVANVIKEWTHGGQG